MTQHTAADESVDICGTVRRLLTFFSSCCFLVSSAAFASAAFRSSSSVFLRNSAAFSSAVGCVTPQQVIKHYCRKQQACFL